MSDAWERWLEASLSGLEEANLLRELAPLEPESAVNVRAEGRPITLFSSNDYLGYSHHPVLRRRVAETVQEDGMGPRGSPLICGYTTEHEALEDALSELEGTEETLLFPTGFAANLAVMTSFANDGTAIFSDALNHASIIDGCRLARRGGATLEVYDHADPSSLRSKLEASSAERKVIVTDSVFSMDGDLAPLDALAALAERHDALLVIDEAHGTLVYGERGAGVSEHFGVGDRVDINIGTLSKAIGSMGGFVSTSERWKEWILNRGRSYIYSTAPALAVVAACRASLDIHRREAEPGRRLWRHVERLEEALGAELASPIVPIILGREERALEVSEGLLERGIHATAIRPPTVPEGSSRIRVTLSAAHEASDIEHLVDALGELGVHSTVANGSADR
jgi:8-amino-7-oxononanoate synthase